MAERDFDKERKTKPGHKFTLGGEDFHTYPGMSVTFVNRDREADDEAQYAPLDRTINFIRSLIVKEDRPRFDALIKSEDVYIEADDLITLSNWLVEVVSGRPTKRPVSSGNGAKPTGTGSKAKSTGRAAKPGKS